MAAITDTQIDKVLFHGQTAHQEIHTPSGKIPLSPAEAPLPSITAGTTAVAKTIVTPFQRIATVA
jgi:hypothetical protein